MKNWVIKFGILIALLCIDYTYRSFVVPNFDYPVLYFYAGLAGILTVAFLRLFGKSVLVKRLQILQIIWVAVHAYGFVIYMVYFPPVSYNFIQVILNIAQILIIIVSTNDTTEPIHDFCRVSHVHNDDSDLRRICDQG